MLDAVRPCVFHVLHPHFLTEDDENYEVEDNVASHFEWPMTGGSDVRQPLAELPSMRT